MFKNRVPWFLIVLVVMVGFWWAGEHSRAERAPAEKKQTAKTEAALDPAVAAAKEKGFDGVDFSYDLFGAPPGQDVYKMAE